jgi:2-aminoethylphosphonate-pyruvate transaminase
MRELGFQLFLPSPVQSYIITAFTTPADPKFSFDSFYRLLSDRGFIIYPGKLTQVDTFRIGNIGRLFPSDLDQLVHAIRGTLGEMGCAVPVSYR